MSGAIQGLQQIGQGLAAPRDKAVSDPEIPAPVDPGWETLARVAAGDADAFGSLVEAPQERVLRLCDRMLGDAGEGRDAAQEGFLKAHRTARDVRPRGQG